MNETAKTYNAVKVASYSCFNERRYSDPWAALLDERGKVESFVGRYSGGRRTGNEGDLYIMGAAEGRFYAVGQKDYRGNGSTREYYQIVNGEAVKVDEAATFTK